MRKVMVINIGTHFGGAEKYIYESLRLNEFRSFKYFVAVRESNRLHQKLLDMKGVKVFTIKDEYSFLSLIFKLYSYCKREKIDIIHAHTTASNLIGSIVSILLKKPIITTIHGIVEFDYPNVYKRKIYLLLEKALLLINKKYICVSNYVKDYLDKKGYKSKKLEVVYNGVNINKHGPQEVHEIKKNLKISNDVFVLGTVGRLEKVKNPILLIKITNELINKGYNCQCIIVGEGSLKTELEKYASELGIAEKVHFIGYSDNPHMYVQAMDVYIHASIMETFGLTVVEAAILDKFVVCNEVGALPEISQYFHSVKPVETNNIEEFTKAIFALMDSDNKQNTDQRNSTIFTWKNNIKKVEGIYQIY